MGSPIEISVGTTPVTTTVGAKVVAVTMVGNEKVSTVGASDTSVLQTVKVTTRAESVLKFLIRSPSKLTIIQGLANTLRLIGLRLTAVQFGKVSRMVGYIIVQA